ncbi:uncharacterized protein HaLaN_04658 [Haematococcus lacustris]|uniref:Uncharacterized protein n=1 Tax=Haematococcus lacustris TaxID=44745 RepID=A0A699YJ40_HAELA|nr:uncharacterized protein HaLaN_04658 [Haematococcus lacustris]
MAFAPNGNALAVGTYAGTIGIWDPRLPELQLLLQGHKGGLTQLLYTHDSNFLLSGARQDPHLLCWDLRMAGGLAGGDGPKAALYQLPRDTATTNQRIAFSLEPCGRHVATGGCDGSVRIAMGVILQVFDLQTGSLVDTLPVASDTVNGCAFHPSLPLLAVATGLRTT